MTLYQLATTVASGAYNVAHTAAFIFCLIAAAQTFRYEYAEFKNQRKEKPNVPRRS